MTHIQAVDVNKTVPKNVANYNAIKIQINDPKTIIPDGYVKPADDNNIYNAVNLEINRPTVEYAKKSSIYDYPTATCPVCYDVACSKHLNLPKLPISPISYQTTNFINNRTFVNAEVELEPQKKCEEQNLENSQLAEVPEEIDLSTDNVVEDNEEVIEDAVIVEDEAKTENSEINENNIDENISDETINEPITEEIVEEEIIVLNEPSDEVIQTEELTEVPSPKLSKLFDNETEVAKNSEIAFRGLSFKGTDEIKHKVEIVPSEEIKPEVNISEVVANLTNSNYDVQAQQMETIAKIAMEDSQKVVPYLVTEVFNSLIDILKNDTTNLEPPTEEQIDIRKKIIINEVVKEQSKISGEANKVELPYVISDEDKQKAMKLSPLELAERNKEYGLYTIAILSKVYTDEVEKHTGKVVPLTDLPGASDIVDTLRYSQNPGVRIAAIDALRYMKKDEYKEELTSLFTLVAQDPNPQVSRNAILALESLK